MSTTVGFTGGTFYGRYLYLAPSPGSAVTLRYNTTGGMANAGTWTAFRTSSVDPRALSFVGSVTDGRYVYFVPNGGAAGPTGVIARYDAEALFQQTSSWNSRP